MRRRNNRKWHVLMFGSLLPFLALYACFGAYGFNVFKRRGVTWWDTVAADDTSLPAPVRLGLEKSPPAVQAGDPSWETIADGFEIDELAVLSAGKEVDRILLARIDPMRFRFEMHNAPAGDKELDDWMHSLGALAVINGSYFSKTGMPDTPFLSQGVQLGPEEYDARHGAFIASSKIAGIVDLKDRDWHVAFAGARDAMVSYPLLLASDGTHRVPNDRGWLANRSFIAQDQAGNIVLGTTREAFFTLERLARFLKDAPLQLKVALNLDGGPVACQAIALNRFKRNFCGAWELQTTEKEVKVLRPGFGNRRFALPIILAVFPKA